MNVKTILVAALVLGCTILPIVMIFAYEALRTQDLTHEILARAPERGNFLPQKLTVPVGKKVRLRVRNVDTVTHGFTIPGLGIEGGAIKAGRSVIYEFTPQQAGTFDFYCTMWCSDHHLQMRGVIEVTAE